MDDEKKRKKTTIILGLIAIGQKFFDLKVGPTECIWF